MNKGILAILCLMFLIITSCEEENNPTQEDASIEIIYPYEGYNFIYEGQPLEIIAKINNKDAVSAAYISINNNNIASGLSDTLIAYYEPNSNINQNLSIEASLVGEENQMIASDNVTISINTIGSSTLNSESVFMNVNNEFMMMRTPVTNRQFLNFLNTNEQLNVEVNVSWEDQNQNGLGDPSQCEYDPGDNYQTIGWWYVNVTTNYASESIPPGEYSVYKNADDIYNLNSDYSGEAGRIQYDCQTETFYLPNEGDGSESIYLDHPVVGVSWIGANVYANYFGWSLPAIEQWNLAAKGNNEWIYPWDDDTINQNYANYDNDNTSQVQYYNGLDDLNLSLSAYGLYDMAGNVWEYTSSPSGTDAYIKTGGAFDDGAEKLEIGSIAYTLWEQVSYNTGFRCITGIDYISSPPSGCMNQEGCNYDMFAESSSDCFEDDCLNLCGGNTEELEFFQDLDLDGFGNPDVSEFQCAVPELGWTDNNIDIDDNCFSDNSQQDNIDCNETCDGTAYYDGCNECVGGETGIEPCSEDCNGDEGGEAEWDDCGVCSGGNSGHEANSDMDCNNDCPEGTPNWDQGLGGTASIDQCGICSGGNTNHIADSDIDDCGVCFGNGYQNYCIDSDNNSCCDCDQNGETCELDTDNLILCESELEDYHIENILACSNSNAENYYCDEEENECTSPLGTPILPCNFIDDGSCVVYGCSDDGEQDWSPYPGQAASNYDLNYGATICQDGSLNNCCEYIEALQLSFGNIDLEAETIEILISIPEYESLEDYVYGFQFNIEGMTLTGADGGLAEEAGFTLSTGGSTVLGFSFSGDYIGQGEGVLTNLSFSSNSSTVCIDLGTGGFSNGYQPPTLIPVSIGDCYEF